MGSATAKDLEQLYQNDKDVLVKAAYGIVRDYSKAEDVVQSAFAKALEKLSQYRGESTLKAWLYSIVRHEALQVVRSGKHEESVSYEEVKEERHTAPPASAEAERKEERAILANGIAGLTEGQQAAVQGRLAGKTYEEIAEEGKTTPAAVRVMHHRARLAMTGYRVRCSNCQRTFERFKQHLSRSPKCAGAEGIDVPAVPLPAPTQTVKPLDLDPGSLKEKDIRSEPIASELERYARRLRDAAGELTDEADRLEKFAGRLRKMVSG